MRWRKILLVITDGFIIVFFQACWEMFKEDNMSIFHDFHAKSKFEKSLNATSIALISNKFRVVDVKDFQPISLVSGVYKIIAKVLINRLGGKF